MLVETETTTTALAPRTTPARRAASNARIETIRAALSERLVELAAERTEALADLELSGGIDAGDDVADLGTKAFAREQEFALVNAIQARIDQVERAMQRLAEGRYGWCEGCSGEIPVARITAFPSATLCIACKQLEERR